MYDKKRLSYIHSTPAKTMPSNQVFDFWPFQNMKFEVFELLIKHVLDQMATTLIQKFLQAVRR